MEIVKKKRYKNNIKIISSLLGNITVKLKLKLQVVICDNLRLSPDLKKFGRKK